MKLFNRLVAGAFLSFVFFTSCNKQIDKPASEEAISQPSIMMPTSCKPAIYGMYEANTSIWTTIAQKWYASGKVQYIKTHFTGRPPTASSYRTEPMLNIDWGQVTYEGNQVRVWDQAQNRLVFRATLNESGKPVASYLYNQMGTEMFIDTSYYYYTGDRMNYIIQLFEKRSSGVSTSRGWEQYTFNYNAAGNLSDYWVRNEKVLAEFTYGSAVSGSLADYVLTTAFRMLEYLELTKLPTNSTLSEIRMTGKGGIHPPYTFYAKRFVNYAITDGLVRSYQFPYWWVGGGQNFYIGWDCGATAATSAANKQSSVVRSLEQFKGLYPASGK